MTHVSLTEKIGYALGDTASNLVFQILVLFAMAYYTDTVGISPAVVATLFLFVRFIDAFTDPIMGRIADKTKTTMGRYRPWLLWLAIPFGVSGVLTFSVPQTSSTLEVVYVFCTYILITLVYTAINIPYSALISSMTNDPAERQQIQSWRFVGGQLGALIIGMFTLPLVEQFGGGSQGWRNTLMVYGFVAAVMFIICFLTTKERVGVVEEDAQDQNSLLKDLSLLWQNDQWRILCAINFVLLTALILRVQTVNYFIKDSMGVAPKDVGALVSAYFTVGGVAAISASFVPNIIAERIQLTRLLLPLASQIALSALVVSLGVVPIELAMHASVIVAVLITVCILVGQVIDRVPMLTFVFAGLVASQLVLFWIGASDFFASALAFTAVGILNQVAVPILWALMADSVDYGEAKTGVRLPALTFSTILFALKAGIAMAGFLGGMLLAWYGYQSGTEGEVIVQSERTRSGIVTVFALLPALITLLLVYLSSRISLTKNKMTEVVSELDARKSAELSPT